MRRSIREGMTAAFVVTHKGRIVAERYGDGITRTTALESWSMGKSLSGTLMGILIKQGAYDLWQRAPIPEWQQPGDPRAAIRIADILRMSSGLRIRAPQDPDYDANGPYPDHLYLYTGSVDSFKYAATRPLQWPPNTVGRYRNTDPVLTNYLIRLAVEKRKEDYHAFPQRALFDKIGIRNMVMDTDPYGNFLTQGYEQGAARDWARLANLYLQDGVWNGERLLPEGYVKFVQTLAPAWEADKRPVYGGGLFWLNGESSFPAPKEAFYMTGVGGQSVLIIPSHQMVVVRLGHYKGVARWRARASKGGWNPDGSDPGGSVIDAESRRGQPTPAHDQRHDAHANGLAECPTRTTRRGRRRARQPGVRAAISGRPSARPGRFRPGLSGATHRPLEHDTREPLHQGQPPHRRLAARSLLRPAAR